MTNDRCTWVAHCTQPVAGAAVSPYGQQLQIPETAEVCLEHARVATAAGWVVNIGTVA